MKRTTRRLGIPLAARTAITAQGTPASAATTLTNNSIHENTAADVGQTGTTATADHNWWGCKAGPGHAGCDAVAGTVTFVPWLTAVPQT